MASRALVTLPPRLKRGEAFELKLLVAHPMETGQRMSSEGQRIAQDIVRRFELTFEGELALAVDLHPAIAANPYFSVWLALPRSGLLRCAWRGDNGYLHREDVVVTLE